MEDMTTTFPWTLTEREQEAAEAYISEHGLASWLDHLGLDGVANDVPRLIGKKPTATYECEMTAPADGQLLPGGMDDVVSRVRDLAWPVIVARFEGVTRAKAEEYRDEINGELRALGAEELGPLRLVRRKP